VIFLELNVIEQLISQLNNHEPLDAHEASSKELTLGFISVSDGNIRRDNNIHGHITGSAWILSPDLNHVLLIDHPKLKFWLPPGGHVEPEDVDIQATVMREAIEETEITDLVFLSNDVFDIDAHIIPDHKDTAGHYHYDFCFVLKALSWPAQNQLDKLGLKWVSVLIEDNADEIKLDSLKRMRLKTKTLLVDAI
jgi:8-oxo-dGTP pyrophosphatase MutT (NUDIX family)